MAKKEEAKPTVHKQCFGTCCALTMSVLCIFTSFVMLGGFFRLAIVLDMIHVSVAEIGTAAADTSNKVRNVTVTNIKPVYTFTNRTWHTSKHVHDTVLHNIKTTKHNILDQAAKFYVARVYVDFKQQGEIVNASIAIYDNLDREVKNLKAAIKPDDEKLQKMLKDFHAEGVLGDITAITKMGRGGYHSLVNVYKMVYGLSNIGGHSTLPVLYFPPNPFGGIISTLQDLLGQVKWLYSGVDKAVETIVGEIPSDPSLKFMTVKSRIEELATAIGASADNDKATGATNALARFHANTETADEAFGKMSHVLGNLTGVLGDLQNVTIATVDMIDEMTAALQAAPNFPDVARKLVYGQISFCEIMCVWIIFYTLCGHIIPGKCRHIMYTGGYVLCQLFLCYTILILIAIVLIGAPIYGLLKPACHIDSITEAVTFCTDGIIPFGNAYPVTLVAVLLNLIFAVNLMGMYHFLSSDLVPELEGEKGYDEMSDDGME
jgi:hypothetical protein